MVSMRSLFTAVLVGLGATQVLALATPADTKPCVICPQVIPTCPACPSGKECYIVPQTCTKCSFAECRPKECVVCPQVVPTCPACPKGQECKVEPQTCKKCATASCKPKPKPATPQVSETEAAPASQAEAAPSDCVICPQVIPTCPACPPGKRCRIVPQTCQRCAFAECV